jgi:hypothetical protein
MWIKHQRKAAVAILLCSVLLASCSFFGKSKSATHLKSIEVSAEAQANRSSSTAIDFLFVYEPGVLPLLPADAGTWFLQREGLRNTLGGTVDVVSVEVPPPYRSAQVQMPARFRHAIRVMAYANYLPRAGQAPIDMTAYRHVILKLLADRIDYTGE